MSDDNSVAFDLERQNIGDDANTQPGGHSRRQVAPLRRSAEDRSTIAARFDSICSGSRSYFRTVVGETGVFHHNDDIRAVLAELICFSGDSGRTEEQGVNLASARFVGEHPRGGDCFQSNLSNVGAARFGEREDVRHQRTFASVWSSVTSSGTAAAPSPMMRPALRSGGSSSFLTVTWGCGICACFTSSGFFFAAMIPLSDG